MDQTGPVTATDTPVQHTPRVKRYSILTDGWNFSFTTLASLIWMAVDHDFNFVAVRPSQIDRDTPWAARILFCYLACMGFIYLLSVPLGGIAYLLSGKRAIANRLAFAFVALSLVILVAAGKGLLRL
jgi:hypothetical protein